MSNAASLRTMNTGAGFESEIERPGPRRLDPVRCVVWGLLGLYLIPVALVVGLVALVGLGCCGLCKLIGTLRTFWTSGRPTRRIAAGWRWDPAESPGRPHKPGVPSRSRSPWV